MANCKKCGYKISGNYITAMGGSWHSHCFICASCKKTISSKEFLTFADRPYHKNCLKCRGCAHPITGSYIKHEGGAWHSRCYKHQHQPRCSVCRKPLTNRHLVDFWGNSYCITHKDFASCISCGRIVCENLTGGGMQYPDGLLICGLCGLHGVGTQERAERLMTEMRSALASVGLKLNSAQVPLKLCDRDELHGYSRHDFHKERPILGLASWTTTYSGKKIIARTFKTILIQNNLPEEHFRTVAIHELTHAWFFYNHYRNLPLEVEEGMCVLMEYIWLKSQKTQDAKYRRILIAKSPDPIYGNGFRKARDSLKLMPLSILLDFLKDNNMFPSRLKAFFYR
ncbi:MAG: protein DA1 [Candidatus Endonucleobacter bathymodioli]|uniref:Protein DA1 n=1 Tax=Candidatus Endonucleibacter bathymodioli TaxID=539814 RepID=A0AA90NQY2_9GAMM|nr:protein DA1 [Candidatus Endonucleobacter bathymodioli]